MVNKGIQDESIKKDFSDGVGFIMSVLVEKRNNLFLKRLIGTTGAIGLSAFVHTATMGEMVYEGGVGEYQISYEEGAASGNVMKMTQGRRVYLFSDNVGQTSITDNKEVKFDGLESLTFFDGEKFVSYQVTENQELLRSADAYSHNYISRNDDIAVQADVLYNNIRKTISDRIKNKN